MPPKRTAEDESKLNPKKHKKELFDIKSSLFEKLNRIDVLEDKFLTKDDVDIFRSWISSSSTDRICDMLDDLLTEDQLKLLLTNLKKSTALDEYQKQQISHNPRNPISSIFSTVGKSKKHLLMLLNQDSVDVIHEAISYKILPQVNSIHSQRGMITKDDFKKLITSFSKNGSLDILSLSSFVSERRGKGMTKGKVHSEELTDELEKIKTRFSNRFDEIDISNHEHLKSEDVNVFKNWINTSLTERVDIILEDLTGEQLKLLLSNLKQSGALKKYETQEINKVRNCISSIFSTLRKGCEQHLLRLLDQDSVYVIRQAISGDILSSITGMQSRIGMITKNDFENLITLFSPNGSLQKEWLSLFIARRNGKGMIGEREYCELIKLIDERRNPEGAIPYADFQKLIADNLGVVLTTPILGRVEGNIDFTELDPAELGKYFSGVASNTILDGFEGNIDFTELDPAELGKELGKYFSGVASNTILGGLEGDDGFDDQIARKETFSIPSSNSGHIPNPNEVSGTNVSRLSKIHSSGQTRT
jgi:hypothetical protein